MTSFFLTTFQNSNFKWFSNFLVIADWTYAQAILNGAASLRTRNMNSFQGLLSQPSSRTKKVKMSPEEKEDDLDSTDDGKSSEKSHGASNETQLSLRLDLLVSLNVVKSGRVKVDLHQMESRIQFFPCKMKLVKSLNNLKLTKSSLV